MAAWIKSVQVSTGTLLDGSLTTTIALTKGQVPDNCLCRMTTNVIDVTVDDLSDLCLTARVEAEPDQVELQRLESTGDIIYVLTIWEVNPAEASVEQVIFSVAGAANTQAIGTVDLDHAFITGYARETVSAGDDYGECCFELTFNSTTEVQAERDSSQVQGEFEVICWVVSATNTGSEAFTVQDFSLNAVNVNPRNVIITSPVVLADTITFYSYKMGLGTDDTHTGAVVGKLDAPGFFELERATGTSPTYDVTVFIVTMDDASVVQRGEFALNSTNDPEDDTISTVDLTRSMAHSPNGPCGPSSITGRIFDGGISGTKAANATFEIINSTTVRGQNDTAGGSVSTHPYEVVEFELSAGGGVSGDYFFIA